VTSPEANDLSSLRDEELLVLIGHSDEQALGALYDRYGRLIFSMALRITGDRQTAEEVTQDVFQIVWQQTAAFRPASGTIAAWIIGITRHRAIDRIRTQRHKARQKDAPIDDAMAAVLSDNSSVENDSVLRSDIRAALGDLPNEQRHVIELAYYGGLTTVEIASSMGTPVGTVKTRLRLGLSRLRAALLPGWITEEQA
jgi:RNA polymerase sigma-70 factor (ECF subfamily)